MVKYCSQLKWSGTELKLSARWERIPNQHEAVTTQYIIGWAILKSDKVGFS